MNPVRKRRLILIALVLAAVGVATGLTVLALQQNMTYLYSPSEVEAGHAPAGARFRLGGVVLEHSIERTRDSLKVDFIVTDRIRQLPVEYTGILPDLFREGQSIVATGTLQGGRFVATEVLAKHDETYMPPEVRDAIEKAKHVEAAGAAPAASTHAAQ
ncbi:MAG: cytochrome c maturation protein CcmE [Dokdonella sp.]|uniref:cytochrome c maturation protein CcmE n=1 Tax=Dokdonella sp. TaxID=2291710 RepID=UPI0025C58CF1|nr:cytochrome c maturation protein CcmE [Dokdonella sp.]MBX3699686.1 cytochrome c maturation protein CcmE [Dokdonella sp.]